MCVTADAKGLLRNGGTSASPPLCIHNRNKSPEGKTFTNPVITDGSRPDPTIWFYDGTFYMLSTSNSNTIEASKDMVSWAPLSPVMDAQACSAVRSYGNDLWAPDVVQVNGHWNYYITVRNSAEDSGICVLQSDSPTGPFKFIGRLTDSKLTGIIDSIDPEVVTDPSDGSVWLFFGSIGKMHRVRLNADGTALAPGAAYEHVAGLTPAECTRRDKVFEGCYLHRHGRYWYLFASTGEYYDETYKVVVGRSKTLGGTFVDKQGRKMADGFASEVIAGTREEGFYGPGHNGEIFTDSSGQDYIFYHCHYDKLSPARPGRRYLMLQRLFWDKKGWPYVLDGKPAATDIAPAL